MSGSLVGRAAARELEREITSRDAESIEVRHAELFTQFLPERRPLSGAVELLRFLRESNVTYGIATSGRRPEIDASLAALGVGKETVVIQRGDVARA